MKKIRILCLIFITAAAMAMDYDIKDFGAKGDGKANDTEAIQKAIDTCSKTGGVVLFPSGTFNTGMIHLKSNVNIVLTNGAVWAAIPDQSLYPVFEKNRLYESNKAFIYGENLENLQITGEGMIYGRGERKDVFSRKSQLLRPYGVYLVGCKNVQIRNINMKNSAFWMLRVYKCSDVIIRGIQIFNHGNGNNDGIDIVDSERVIVSDCIIDSSDDAVCIKSESYQGTKDVTVTNCVISSFASAIKCGTAAYTGYKRIAISNCVIKPSRSKEMNHPYEFWRGIVGIDLNNVDGGVMEDITINNIMMDSIMTPIFIRLGKRNRTWQYECLKDTNNITPGIVRNIQLSNIIAKNGGRISSSITGYPDHYVENIRLFNIDMHLEGSGTAEDVTTPVPEKAESYPVSAMFKVNLPSYGFFLRHVKNLTMDHVTIRTNNPDPRYEIVAEDVHKLTMLNFNTSHPERDKPFMKFENCSHIKINSMDK